jgi:hypothetical protein
MSTGSTPPASPIRALLASPKVQLGAFAVLAVVVLIRLALMTYWSWDDGSRSRLVLVWALALFVLVMLARFAWHLLSGRENATSQD